MDFFAVKKTSRLILLATFLFSFYGCEKEYLTDNLADYLAENSDLERDELIACAAGNSAGIGGDDYYPTSVFFYPVDGASDFRYFEAPNVADSMDFSKYTQKFLTDEPVFNGYLWKFNNTDFTGERMGVVTYKTEGKLHVCTPIRLKKSVKPTEVNPTLLTITENGVNPKFSWTDGLINENVIYFQVVTNREGDLISGTYTYEQEFTFYDLSNVVLNVSPTSPQPALIPGEEYTFTLMAVSEDNWVNLICEQDFTVPE